MKRNADKNWPAHGLNILLMLLILTAAGCVKTKTHYPMHPTLLSSELPPLIPIEDLFDNKQERYRFKVSPDGKKLAWVEEIRGNRTVHFKTIGEDAVENISTFFGNIHSYRWAQDSQRILVNYGKRGKENNYIYSFDSRAPNRRPVKLIDFMGMLKDKKRALIHSMLIDDPEHILALNNDRDLTCYDLYKLNIRMKRKELIAENPGDVKTWITDRKGDLRARIRVHETTKNKILEAWKPDDQSWRKVVDMDFEDVFGYIGFDAESDLMWALSNRNRDKVGLVKFSLENGEEEVIYEDGRVDVDNYEYCRETERPYLVYLEPDITKIVFLDPEIENDFKPLFDRIREDHFTHIGINSSDNNARVFTIFAYSDKDWMYFLFDRHSGHIEELSRNPLSEYARHLSDIQPISFTSGDGMEIHGYLTTPKGAPPKNLPMVVLVHGGPWSRDTWGFNKRVQFFANRGYAVLQINFRGSDGYGRKYMEAAVGEFAGKMQTDLIDGANWAIDKGIADPDKIAIVGASYGGYAALVGLTFTPDFFVCGIDVFGPSDLESLLKVAPIWWTLGMPKFYKYIGNPDNPEDLEIMKSKSPIYRLDAIERPLLVIYGGEDPRVAKKQSSSVIEKLTQAGKDFEWHSFPDEGHGFYDRNRITYYNLIQTFLARHLGGRMP